MEDEETNPLGAILGILGIFILPAIIAVVVISVWGFMRLFAWSPIIISATVFGLFVFLLTQGEARRRWREKYQTQAIGQPERPITQAVVAADERPAVRCPNCGSEELIEFENERIMIPYEDAERNYVIMSAVNYVMCAKCETMMGSVPIDDTHPKAPVAGVRYQACEVCGGTEFTMNIFTKIRMTADRVEDLSESYGPVLCLRCGHEFKRTIDDMAANAMALDDMPPKAMVAVAVPHDYEVD
ncbi:MAG: hypothetical protein JRN66_05825 [Nitrososphaerota archaeon]|nr:hypothetical protein [Nitrososphaerota archaeon]